MTYPTITARELQSKATRYADKMIAALEAINKRYPMAELTPEEEALFVSGHGEDALVRAVCPENLRLTFESAFYRYMAALCVVVPD